VVVDGKVDLAVAIEVRGGQAEETFAGRERRRLHESRLAVDPDVDGRRRRGRNVGPAVVVKVGDRFE
jgi:hypothetical protein